MDIDELKSGDVVAKELFLVAEASLLKDKRGQDYYNLKLNHVGAKTIQAKVWSSNISEPINAGDVLEVYGRVDDRFGLQIDMQQYVHKDPSSVDLSLYVKTTDVDVTQGFEDLFNWADGRSDVPEFVALMMFFHDNERFAADFKTSPAAMVHHHNYQGGLVEHTLEVYNLAELLGKFYGDQIDRDLLLAGAALHDIGKIKSYVLTTGVSQMTDAGSLLAHVFISASMVSNVWDVLAKEHQEAGGTPFDATRKHLLLHAILAHHGRIEWGSPVLPQVPEALLLYLADNTSAMMKSTFDAITNKKPSTDWTDFVYIMDAKRRFFVPSRA